MQQISDCHLSVERRNKFLLFTDDLPRTNPKGKSWSRAAPIVLILKWLSWACLMVLHHKLMDLWAYMSGLWWLAVALLGLQVLGVLGLGLLVEWGCDKYIKKLVSSDFASFTDFFPFKFYG